MVAIHLLQIIYITEYFFTVVTANNKTVSGQCTTTVFPGNNKCYWVAPDSSRSKSDSVGMCAYSGGTLPKIESQSLTDFMVGQLTLPSDFYIGLDDTANETVFKWFDGTPLGSYNNWDTDQPDGKFSNDLVADATVDCVVADSSGQWSDELCNSFSPVGVVCEKDGSDPSPRSGYFIQDPSESIQSSQLLTKIDQCTSKVTCAVWCVQFGGQSFQFDSGQQICDVYKDESGGFDKQN